jgi:hypothetical protein
MAKVKRPAPKKAVPPLKKPQMQPKASQQVASPVASIAQSSVSSAIGSVFQNDDDLRKGITDNLKKRLASNSVSTRAKAAFSNFKPSSHPASVRANPNFVAPGGQLTHAQQGAMDRSLESLRNSSTNRTITLHQTDALTALIKKSKSASGSAVGTISLPNLVSYLNSKVPAATLIARQTPITNCQAQIEAEAAMKGITGAKTTTSSTTTAGAKPPADPGQTDDTPEDDISDFSSLSATQVVKDNVGLQMKTATSPETQLMYAIPNTNPTGNIDTFELRQGPSDVTSYHDFNTLQIAFESVWTELFDSQFASLGQQLYQEYVNLKVFTGTDDGTDPDISTLDDLTDLMNTIKSFTNTIADSLPPNLQPSDTSQTSGDSLSNSVLGTATEFIGDLINPVQGTVDLANAIARFLGGKISLTWSDFLGPLPGGNNDQINVTIKKGVLPPGNVEFLLQLGPGLTAWKGIQLMMLDAQQNATNLQRIEAENDSHGALGSVAADGTTTSSLAVMPTALLPSGVLEFQKAGTFGPQGYYRLGNLSEISDGSQVTFTWIRPLDP